MTADDSTPSQGQDGDEQGCKTHANEVLAGLRGAWESEQYDSGASIRVRPLEKDPHAAVSVEFAGSWGVTELSLSLDEAERLAVQLEEAAREGAMDTHSRD